MKNNKPCYFLLPGFFFLAGCLHYLPLAGQDRRLTPENIRRAFAEVSPKIQADSLRPAFHLCPPAGCMGDPNGGIYHNGWYHIFLRITTVWPPGLVPGTGPTPEAGIC
ncbi:MAG: hypothetical protein HC880_18225 [Bacteroidia bacterium]|nr:hypothetical protein [Bacteroidia bacterium]